MSEIWPYLLTAMVTAVGTYVGAIHKLRIKVAVLENRVERMSSIPEVKKAAAAQRHDKKGRKTTVKGSR